MVDSGADELSGQIKSAEELDGRMLISLRDATVSLTGSTNLVLAVSTAEPAIVLCRMLDSVQQTRSRLRGMMERCKRPSRVLAMNVKVFAVQNSQEIAYGSSELHILESAAAPHGDLAAALTESASDYKSVERHSSRRSRSARSSCRFSARWDSCKLHQAQCYGPSSASNHVKLVPFRI